MHTTALDSVFNCIMPRSLRVESLARGNLTQEPRVCFVYLARGGVDESGFSVSGGFDMNGDGLSDFIIGAPGGGTAGDQNGEAYVVFGQV